MILLIGTSESITLQTLAAGSIDYVVSYVDMDATTYTPGVSMGNITTAATTTIVPAPAAGVTRQIKHMAITNRGATQTVHLRKTTSGSPRALFTPLLALRAECSLQYAPERGFNIEFPNGMPSQRSAIMRRDGKLQQFVKPGTTAEAVAIWHFPYGTAGVPAAWAIGTPGLAGRVCNNTDTGAYPVLDTASGRCRIQELMLSSAILHTFSFFDVLWVNTGILVTNTPAQTINSVTFPARDFNGTTDGEGVQVGLLVTTATTNAAAIGTITISYTNQDGVAGRSGFIPSFPATAALYSFLPFALQAGDRGVRSIQSITLGTSLVAGAVSLVAYRRLCLQGVLSMLNEAQTPRTYGVETQGFDVFDTACLLPAIFTTATTAVTVQGEYLMTEV